MAAEVDDVGSRGTQVVDRVFDILDAFVQVGPALSVTDVSRRVGLKYSTAHRLLEAMARRDILARDVESRRYRIGPQLRQVALASIGNMGLFHYARPLLEELTKATGETSHLAVLVDGMALYVDKVESERMLSRPSHVGRRLPAYCTGVGKAMLAYAAEEQVEAVIARGLERITANTITDAARLRTTLAEVRRRGYAIDDEEIEEGLICVAAPILDHEGGAVAGVSIGGPASRVRHAGLDQIARHVMATARAISAVLASPKANPEADGARASRTSPHEVGIREV